MAAVTASASGLPLAAQCKAVMPLASAAFAAAPEASAAWMAARQRWRPGSWTASHNFFCTCRDGRELFCWTRMCMHVGKCRS